MPSKSKGDQAKELLTKYGGAYLATSITLSLISFSLCYALITAGVDVPALLLKVIIIIRISFILKIYVTVLCKLSIMLLIIVSELPTTKCFSEPLVLIF